MNDRKHWCPSFDITSTLVEAGADVNAISDTAITPLQRATEAAEHQDRMRIGLFKTKSMSMAASLAMTPEHPQWQCTDCNMTIDAKDIAFSCKLCESPDSIVLCCVCFLFDSWCGDRTHSLASSWVDPNGCAREVQTGIMECNALKQGSIVALLRSRGAMMSDEVRRHYESTLGRPIPFDAFQWLAATGAISSAGQDIQKIWLSMFGNDEISSSDENEYLADSQMSHESLAPSWQQQSSQDSLSQEKVTGSKQDKRGFSTIASRFKTKTRRGMFSR